MRINLNFQWISFALGVILILFLMERGCNETNLRQAQSLLSATQDTLHTVRNKLGQETASRIAFQTSSEYFKRNLKSTTDSMLQKLIKEVTKNTVSATQVKSVTASNGWVWPEMTGDSCDPVYKGVFVSVWDSVNIAASRKKITFGYEVYNEYRIEQELKSKGWFKPKDLIVKVHNLNPHTRTLALQSFHINYPVHRIGIGPVVGVGINSSFMPVPIVGIGIQYSLIRF